jgi:hypothetical protein
VGRGVDERKAIEIGKQVKRKKITEMALAATTTIIKSVLGKLANARIAIIMGV